LTWQKEVAGKLVDKGQGLAKPNSKDLIDKEVRRSLYQHQGEKNTQEQFSFLLEDISNVT